MRFSISTVGLRPAQSNLRHRHLLQITAFLIAAFGSGSTWGSEGSRIQLLLDGSALEGTPLAWSDSRVLLLGRDGFLWQFAPQKARDYRQLEGVFRPLSFGEMRGQLLREFGRNYDVSGTGNYLVVHPAGQRDRWAHRFEELFRAFLHYFGARGMRPATPEFPLVGVVFRSRGEFARFVEREGGSVSPGGVGFYSNHTNRILLYDVTHGQASDENWHLNAETIIHEATHQMAFNTNIHSRVAVPPRWVAEGLATMFEAPGVWSARRHPHLKDRINRERWNAFRQYVDNGRPADSLARFVGASDRLFFSAPAIAYAEAWALTFYLSEKEPGRYMRYLRRTAERQPLQSYSEQEQLREFTEIFGADLTLLEARYLRFIRSLAAP
jgi:hypothetical protein